MRIEKGMRRIIFILAFFGLTIVPGFSQESVYRYDDATQLWRLTNNAAGLGIDSTRNRGLALFNVEHWDGDYARVQEGTQTNQLRFQTERYQKVGKYLYGYGRLNFDYGRTKNRKWSDVIRPYNANPYIAGSSNSGKYDFQDFDFSAALGTVPFFHGKKAEGKGLRFGLRFDYKAGDLSRLRDPRSRSQLLDYKLSPGITYTFGQHTLGLSGNYHRRKEKIVGLTTVQQDPTMKYYLMSGMEHAEGTIGGYKSFSREWVDHRFGGELSYGFHSLDQNSLLTLSIERGEESAYGQYKYEPGRYVDYRYGLSLCNRFIEGNVVHQFDLGVGYEQAFADEYRLQLNETKDPETGYSSYNYSSLFTYKKRFQVNVFNVDMHYRAHFNKKERERAYVGVELLLSDSENKYLLPTSKLSYGGLQVMAEGGVSIAQHLWIDARAGGYIAESPNLSLADPTTDYAVGVLLPDMKYYEANYWRAHLQISYDFPLKIKGKTSYWFIRAYGDYLKTNNSLDAKCAGLSIGLFN
jgi:hypothetical protein